MEKWDVYDENRRPLNKSVTKGTRFENGEYRLAVHVCIFNKKGEMLIQQRAACKKMWPNLWDLSVGGSVISGESTKDAAERETFEELGIKINLKNQRQVFTINFGEGFDDYYFVDLDIDVNSVTKQTEEVQNVKFATKEEIISILNNGKFIEYHQSFIDFIFDMHEHGWVYNFK